MRAESPSDLMLRTSGRRGTRGDRAAAAQAARDADPADVPRDVDQEIADVLGSSVGAEGEFFHASQLEETARGRDVVMHLNAEESSTSRKARARRARRRISLVRAVPPGTRAAGDDVGGAGREVPEPSPLFWDHLSSRVSGR